MSSVWQTSPAGVRSTCLRSTCDGETMEKKWRKMKKEAKEEEAAERTKVGGKWGSRYTPRSRVGQGV